MNRLFQTYYKYLVALGLGSIALAIPLLRDFHLESAILAATVGCFWAGISSCTKSDEGDVFEAIKILGWLYVFSIPLLVHTIINNCLNVDGVGFWVLLPVPSVFFGFSVGRLLRSWEVSYRKFWSATFLLVITLGVLLVEFFNLPQLYFFNHVWGYWPGPIYDETIRLTGSLIFFRFITLLWVVFLWHLPKIRKAKEAKWIVILSVVFIGVSYSFLNEGGIITPKTYLKQQLSGQEATEHFDIYYDSTQYSDFEIQLTALEHEFYYQQVAEQFELTEQSKKIKSYLYAHPWQKKRLVGAKFTSYVPVWLNQDQLHIAKQQIAGSLKHELVHVMAKQFGNKLFNASWSIGLIEGLATAIDGGNSTTSTLDQIVFAEEPLPTPEEIQATLAPTGFYGGRSTVNYITMGSFVSYLLDNYPIKNFKDAYQSADISDVYGEKISKLVVGWHKSLENTELDSTDERQAERLFSIPSLFEKQCPHVISDFGEAWDRYNYELAQGDTTEALNNLARATALRPQNLRVKSEWAYQNLKAGNIMPVQFEASLQDSSAELQMLFADAFALDGKFDIAQTHITKAALLTSRQSQDNLNDALATRIDKTQWQWYLDITYHQKYFSDADFTKVYYRTKIRAIEKAITEEKWNKLFAYSQRLLPLPVDEKYVLAYLNMIHHLGFKREFELAENWLKKLAQKDLRPRHQQLLEEQKRWIKFLEAKAE